MKIPAWRHKGGGGIRACLAGFALLLALPCGAAALTPSGTVITHDFGARFAAPVYRQARSNQSAITVMDLAAPDLIPPRNATTPAGGHVDFLHTLTNRGNLPDSFNLKATLSGGWGEAGAPPELRFYLPDGVTPVPAGADGSQVLGPVAAGASVDLVLRAAPPAGSEGKVAVILVTASSVAVPARASSLNDQLQVPFPGGLSFLKSVTPAGAVLPGTLLSYRISLANAGSAPVSGVRVIDPLDPLLDYQQGSAALPAGLSGTAVYDAASRSLVYDIPEFPAGFSGELAFDAVVRRDAQGNATIVNTAGITSGLAPVPRPSNSTLNSVRARALSVEKKAGSGVAEAGDIVSFTVRVENVGAAPLEHVTVTDRIPRGFRYLKGSSHLDGFAVGDPVGGSQQLGWDAGLLAPGAVRTLGYRLVLSAEVPVGTSVNWARASGVTATGTASVSPPAGAAVKVRPSILGDKAVILGRIFRDGNGNGVPDPGEPGEPGVRICLEDGSCVLSDAEGNYSFTGVSAGDHVLKIDRSSLAAGLRSVPYGTAFAGVGWSQFVTVPFGGPARGDFALAPGGAAPPAGAAKPVAAGGARAGVACPTGPTAALSTPAIHPATTRELRDWFLVGLGTLTVGGRSVSGNLEKIDKDDRFDSGIFHEERLAFFTRGRILGKYLLAAAYDSDKERRDGVFRAIDPEKYYPVYGDATDIGYEAQSRGKLYLKLQSGRSHLMAGDYRTDLSENEFSRYDRALNGVRLEVNREHLTVKGFESRSGETISRDDIPGNGSSGHYLLSRRPVFENSERVRVEVRDRYHSERVLSLTEMVRYADYSIDYQAGTILFKEPVPSLDRNLNPISIVVTYQASGGGGKRYLYGGRALLDSGRGLYLGGTAVVEEHALKETILFGLDAGWRFRDWLTLKGEGAVSETLGKGRGSAWKADLALRPAEPFSLALYHRKVGSDFFNPSMSGSETGTEKFGGRVDYRANADTRVHAESFVQRDTARDRRLTGNEVGASRRFSTLEADAGVKLLREDLNGAEGSSDLAWAGIKAPVTARLDVTLRREQLLSSSSIAEYQTKTFLNLDYRLSDRTRAFLTGEYREGSPLVRSATVFGLESALTERMRLTTGYRLSSGVAGSTGQQNIDLHTKLMEKDGFSLASRTGYEIEHSLSGERGEAILGLNSRCRLAQGLFVNSTLERVQAVQGNNGTRTAFTLAGEYLRAKDVKLTGRYEIRTGPQESASLYGASAALKATPSLTLMAKGSFWDRDADAGDDLVVDSYLGGAFRPPGGNPWQLLTLLRFKVEKRATASAAPGRRTLILSAEPTCRLVSRWTARGKYAGKFNWSEGVGGRLDTYSDLILAGLSYDLARRWELSAYLRLLNQYDAGMHSLGAVGSAGYRVCRNVVLSAGYNYARLDDRDLTGESYQGQGPFLGVKVKFDEDMFESAEARVTPLPAPTPAPGPVAAAPAEPASPPEPKIVPAVPVTLERFDEPFALSGSAELFTLLVNGSPARLPSTAVTLTRERLASLELTGGRFTVPLGLLTSVEAADEVAFWRLVMMNREGNTLRTFSGVGAPPPRIAWGGETDRMKVVQGEIYQGQLQVTYRDGSVFRTGRELFGVNRREAVLLTLAGGAFVFDKWALTPEAKRLLSGAARVLRERPLEKVVVEGHTDGIGSAPYNLELSRKRCVAAADYLVRVEGIDPRRLSRRWYGKSRPAADNVTTPGRRLNRRVGLKGDLRRVKEVAPDDRYRTRPFAVINGRSVTVDDFGRFETSLPGATGELRIEMGDAQGRYLATELPLPALTLAHPAGGGLLPCGSLASGVSAGQDGSIGCRLAGSVGAGERLEVDGSELPVERSGAFALDLPVGSRDRVMGVVLRNGAGCSKLLNLRLRSEKEPPRQGMRK